MPWLRQRRRLWSLLVWNCTIWRQDSKFAKFQRCLLFATHLIAIMADTFDMRSFPCIGMKVQLLDILEATSTNEVNMVSLIHFLSISNSHLTSFLFHYQIVYFLFYLLVQSGQVIPIQKTSSLNFLNQILSWTQTVPNWTFFQTSLS